VGGRKGTNRIEDGADLCLEVWVLLDFCGRTFDEDTDSFVDLMELGGELVAK
jgi:hypothetical protein